ncbi:MAG: PKD domain-containing protein, partial [Anaerolineae bacterium]|nr:PKD domain-containing protein [Anaerolineae bacterium]
MSLTDGEVMWLNFTLDVDTTPPSVTNLTSVPDASISPNNPATINATLVEKYLESAGIILAMYTESYLDEDNYTILLQYLMQADDGPFPTFLLELWSTGPDSYEMGAAWNGTTTGGWLGDGISQEYMGAGYGDFMGTPYYVIYGQYDNSSMAFPVDSVALFNAVTGALDIIIDISSGSPLDISDPTAVFGGYRFVISVNSTTLQLTNVTFRVDTWWPTTSLMFLPDALVPSGNYLVAVFAEDYGDNFGYNATIVMVDNDPPVADAGSNQTVETPALVQLDATASTDNVAVVNYTWTFTYGGSNVTLYGATPSFQFLDPGIYLVTLTVMDAAGWSSESMVYVFVQDTTPPTPGTPSATPDPQEVYQTVDFSVSVTDNYQVDVVKIEILDPDGVLVGNFTMVLSGGLYTYSSAFTDIGTYSYTVWANDTSDNYASATGQ